MSARTDTLLALLSRVVDHVRAANARAERAEAAAREGEARLAVTEATVRRLREELGAQARACAAAEARAVEANLRICQAAEALGFAAAGEAGAPPAAEAPARLH
ncbi:hypothetical protein U8607_21545 [Methylobacterium durans]|uniref:hypothetical protein n=1 Tax=Methylobacterium durans TaxID=2202825 RepID=UPI002AFE044A|nr:hypothetical protein [Methylobacterium durans]MEA1834682.1 hypothetical protein [Methylobacterium durans]